jgi:hypothetical protein
VVQSGFITPLLISAVNNALDCAKLLIEVHQEIIIFELYVLVSNFFWLPVNLLNS